MDAQMQRELMNRRQQLDESDDSWSDGEDRDASKKKKMLAAMAGDNVKKKTFTQVFGRSEIAPSASASSSSSANSNRGSQLSGFAANRAALANAFAGGASTASTDNDDDTDSNAGSDAGGIEYADSSGQAGWQVSTSESAGWNNYDASSQQNGGYGFSSSSNGAGADDEWTMEMDPDSGFPYYINNRTGESVWEKPPSKPKPPPTPVRNAPPPPPLPSSSSIPQPPPIPTPPPIPSSPPNPLSAGKRPTPPLPPSLPSSSSYSASPSSSSSSGRSPPPAPPIPTSTPSMSSRSPSMPSSRSLSSANSAVAPPIPKSTPTPFSLSNSSTSSPTASFSSSGIPPAPPAPPMVAPTSKKSPWRELFDQSSGYPYYFNDVTKETVWEKPADMEDGSSSSSSVSSATPTPTSSSSSTSSAWRELVDPSSGYPYYENSVTGVTQWDKPADFFGNGNSNGTGSSNGSFSNGNGSSGSMSGSALYNTSKPKTNSFTFGSEQRALDASTGSSVGGRTVKLQSHQRERRSDQFRSNPNQYNVFEFARQHFDTHTRGLIFKDALSVEELFSHSTQKLKKSLLKPPPEDDFFVERAIQIFRNVTGYMLDRDSSKDPYGHALKLSARGLCGSPEMRDEMFCQIMKQITKNPSSSSCERGWQLMSLSCGLFPPSDRLVNYLYCFLLQAVASNSNNGNGINRAIGDHAALAISNLDDTMVNGQRLQTPTLVEVKSYESLLPVVVNVETLDPSLHWSVTCTAQMRIIDIAKQVGEKVMDGAQPAAAQTPDVWLQNFAIFQAMLVNDRLSACCVLSDTSRVLDVLSFWSITRAEFHKKNSDAKLAFKLVYMVQFYQRSQLLLPNMPPLLSHLYYVQSVTDLRRGIYLCTEKEAFYLAALQLQIRLGPSRTPHDYNMLELLPVPLVAANPKLASQPSARRALFDEIEKLRQKEFVSWNGGQCKAQLLSYMGQWKHYGLTTFTVKQIQPRSAKKDRINEIGINEHGLFKIDPKSRAWWQVAPLNKILLYEAAIGMFKFTIGDKTSAAELIFEVQYADEIKKLVQKYKLSARLDDAKGPQQERTLLPIQRKR